MTSAMSSKTSLTPPKALIIDDDLTVCQMLCDVFDELGLEAWGAGEAELAMEIFRRERPRLVFVDLQIPDSDGMALIHAMLAQEPTTAVTLITGFGDESTAVTALRAGARNFLHKPLDLQELRHVINAQVQRVQLTEHHLSSQDEWTADGQSVLVRLPNDTALVPAAADLVERLSPDQLGKDARSNLRLVVQESLMNAIEHGNLGVTYDEKAAALAANRYEELLAERAAEPERSRRQVTLVARATPDMLCVTVTDMGEGFDWGKLPDPRDPANMMRESGRGLFLIHVNCDEVIFNEAGNQVTLIVRFAQTD